MKSLRNETQTALVLHWFGVAPEPSAFTAEIHATNDSIKHAMSCVYPDYSGGYTQLRGKVYSSVVYNMSWKQIRYIKKSDGTILDKPPVEATKAYKKALKQQQQKDAREQARKEGIPSSGVGISFLVLGILASILFPFVWIGVTWSSSILWLILAGLFGYTGCFFIFNAAYKRLLFKKKKFIRVLCAILLPLAALVLAAAVLPLVVQ